MEDVSAVDTAGERTRSRVRYFVLFMVFIVTTLNFADRATLSITSSTMQKELGLDPVQMGYLFSAFAWAYVAGQLPGGWLLDRFGTKRVYAWSIALWSFFTLMARWRVGRRDLRRPGAPRPLAHLRAQDAHRARDADVHEHGGVQLRGLAVAGHRDHVPRLLRQGRGRAGLGGDVGHLAQTDRRPERRGLQHLRQHGGHHHADHQREKGHEP